MCILSNPKISLLANLYLDILVQVRRVKYRRMLVAALLVKANSNLNNHQEGTAYIDHSTVEQDVDNKFLNHTDQSNLVFLGSHLFMMYYPFYVLLDSIH